MNTVNEAKVVYNTTDNSAIALIDDEDDQTQEDARLVRYFADIAVLNQNQRRALIAMLDNLGSGNKKTDQEIADSLGIHAESIYNYRRNPVFSKVLADISVEFLRGSTEKIVSSLMNAVEKGNIKGIELALRVPGVYIPAQKTAMLHVSGGSVGGDIRSVEQYVDAFVLRCATLNMDVERIVDMVRGSFARQKGEGSF